MPGGSLKGAGRGAGQDGGIVRVGFTGTDGLAPSQKFTCDIYKYVHHVIDITLSR